MDILNLNSPTTSPDPLNDPMSEEAIRRLTFLHLLGCVAGNGGLLVDLAADGCTFAKIARDDGYAVTAVDARIEGKPSQEELGSIRFVQSDVRQFDVTGFDVIVILGLLHHFDVDDQMRLLERWAHADIPVILETEIHVDGTVSDSDARARAQAPVAPGPYTGVVTAENDTTLAWIGNRESFRPAEESILRMFADAGFRNVAIVDPLVMAKSGARRFFLLGCERPAIQQQADIVRQQRNYVTSLVKQGRFDEAREIFGPLASVPAGEADWLYELAVAEMQLHFGEHEKAVAMVVKLRDRAMNSPNYAAPALLMCARFFDAAGNKSEADKTKILAIDRLGNAAAVKMLVQRLIKAGAPDDARRLLSGVEWRFADNLDMLDAVAQGHQQMGDFSAAERIWRAALEREPQNNAAMLENLGSVLSSQNKHEEAACVFERALALNSNNTRIVERLISVYLKLKRFAEAEQHARALLCDSPDNPQIHLYLASALKQTRRRKEALDHARRAAELAPAKERYRQYAHDLARLIAKNIDGLARGEADAS